MNNHTRYTLSIALIVALGGFLMGFDASVISGVVGFIEPEFDLSKIELGWAVASLTLTATLAMMLSGPASDRFGRRPVLKVAAVLFAVSAIASAAAPDFATLVAARMLGGLGVGAALIVAPMYIAEIAPADIRGRLVSFNQLNIVIGISAAFFSNYLVLGLADSGLAWVGLLGLDEHAWRWMLGVETIPALFYLAALYAVPESPRWLLMQDRDEQAMEVLRRAAGAAAAEAGIRDIRDSLAASSAASHASLRELLAPRLRLVLTIGIVIAVLQQATGINSVFFYAPMIFEQSGVGTDASFMQAVLVGLVNLVFTVLAILTIDRFGRRPLLAIGVSGIAACMLLLAWGFGTATYTLTADALARLAPAIQGQELEPLLGQVFTSDVDFKRAISEALGADALQRHEGALIAAAITMNPTLVLVGILGFVASFAMSLGPVMWVLFSELFPNRVRGLAISFVGLINSGVSFLVQLLFPWELARIGTATTFFIYGLCALLGLLLIMRLLPETRGKSLEQLERELVVDR
ncbi:MAG: sugar porter family MFS transporter [Gammaproteobacteria bacterium]|nr:sugar porter family MFS transporter [Gammaproteobacteria bacterium]MDH4256202.1 sugar porter family MFS transporter [Gammaproteobacteria bacterium]MDH5311670.1 sugar porter family MFS transporter [Gammaproteobacteria bacterium]